MLDFEVVYFGPILLVFLVVQIVFKVKPRVILLRSVMFLYIVSVIAVTLFPIPIEGVQDFIDAGVELKNNFVPFRSIANIISTQPSWNILRQIVGNMVLLMPLGFFLPLILKKRCDWKKILLIGVLFSFSIELAQFGISYVIGYSYKITDVDDLMLNTVGTMIGYGCYKVFNWGIKKL